MYTIGSMKPALCLMINQPYQNSKFIIKEYYEELINNNKKLKINRSRR